MPNEPLKPTSSQQPEHDRLAVITIQGGGIFGLNLLGQLRYVREKLNVMPVALAGTSAGAIVAALHWSGHKPEKIQTLFSELAPAKELEKPDESELAQLLGPFEPKRKPFSYQSFLDLKSRMSELLQDVRQEVSPQEVSWLNWFWRTTTTPFRLSTTAIRVLRAHWQLKEHFQNRGLFSGDKLTEFIDNQIRAGFESINAKSSTRKDFPFTKAAYPNPLRFGQIAKWLRDRKDLEYPAALYLTMTNVMTGELLVVNSIEEKYSNVVIAHAVRASAGFPFAFRPIQVDGAPTGWYVDGGVISNFPAWVYADNFRQTLLASNNYKAFASRPWVHIGLRLGGDSKAHAKEPTPTAFLRSLGEIITGRVRDEHEERLTRFLGRSHVVRQPADKITKQPQQNATTQATPNKKSTSRFRRWLTRNPLPQTPNITTEKFNVLDIHKLTKSVLNEMVESGFDVANSELQNISFRLPDAQVIEKKLEELVNQVIHIFGLTKNGERNWWFRSSIFMLEAEKLQRRYRAFYRTQDQDSDLAFDWYRSSVGFCYTKRSPIIGNVAEVRALADRGSDLNKTFGITPEEWAKVRKEIMWLATVPIFDPEGRYPRDQRKPAIDITPGGVTGISYSELTSPFDGAVFGTLGLDIGWDALNTVDRTDCVTEWYQQAGIDKNPVLHQTAPRIAATVAVMEAMAIQLGQLFSDQFAVKVDSGVQRPPTQETK